MYESEEEQQRVDLLDYWRVVVRRKWVIAAFLGAVVLFTGIFTFTAKPKYKATSTLLIEEEASKILSIEDEFGYRRQVSDMRFFNTQLRLLKSKSLAERVSRKMNLLRHPEFGAKEQKKSLASGIKSVLSFRWTRNKNDKSRERGEPVNPYSEIADELLDNLDVSPIRDTKLVEVSYTSSNSLVASNIVNALAEEFIGFSIEKRYETTQQASDFLSEQIANLREDLAAKERELQRYGEDKELFFLSDKESVTVSKFADLNEAFTKAQIDRVRAEVNYRELKNLRIDYLGQVVSNPVIQNLTTEYSRMKNEYEEKSKIFKPNYPEMVQLKAKLDSMRSELQGEVTRAVDAAESEYRAALKKETSLKGLLDNQRADVARMNSNAILYNSIKIEVENKRKLLNSLVERQNETLVSARLGGLKTSNVTIIDRAEPPKSPVSPRKKLNMILALIIGLFGGIGLCFGLEYLDNTVKGPEDVERLARLPSLGVIPYLPPEGLKKKRRYGAYYSRYYSYEKKTPEKEEGLPEVKEIELINHLYPRFFISEDYRTIRTSILLSYAEAPPKTIAFSSAMPKEGKTATVANMAVAFSQLQKRVLMVDSDLRKPRLHRIFKAKGGGGLSEYLTGKIPFEEAIFRTDIENIWLIPSGPIPPNPSELLNSNRMKIMLEELKNGFDMILLDTPPVLAVVDPVIVASMADATVLVIQQGKTVQKSLMSAVDELQRGKAKIIGVVLNEAPLKSNNYYSKNYMRYYYYQTEESEE